MNACTARATRSKQPAMRLALLLVILVGCGSDGGSGTPHDAAVDAKPDAPAKLIDAPEAPAGFTHYVIDHVNVPSNNQQARAYGLDLNNDQTVDNQLGMVIATLSGMGFDSQGAMNKSVDQGDTIMLGNLGAADFTTDAMSTFTIYQGENPMPSPCTNAQDTVCRKHLSGMASFSIKPSAPVDPALMGTIAAGKLVAGPGHLTIQFSMAYSPSIMLTLLGARVELTTTKTSLSGKVAGAIPKTDVDMKILPAMRDGFEAVIAKDCTMLTSPPNCGCGAGSQGKTLLGLFDTTPQDCNITLTEVQNNSLIQSLLAPDVTVEGKQCLSLGLGVTAVNGGFAAPM